MNVQNLYEGTIDRGRRGREVCTCVYGIRDTKYERGSRLTPEFTHEAGTRPANELVVRTRRLEPPVDNLGLEKDAPLIKSSEGDTWFVLWHVGP
jgi:hypothetical protein